MYSYRFAHVKLNSFARSHSQSLFILIISYIHGCHQDLRVVFMNGQSLTLCILSPRLKRLIENLQIMLLGRDLELSRSF